jgi:hypothetical protein
MFTARPLSKLEPRCALLVHKQLPFIFGDCLRNLTPEDALCYADRPRLHIFTYSYNNNNNIYNNIITMARQPYMGLGLLFPRLRGLCAFAAVSDRPTAAHIPIHI